jgi:transcriptional regulator with XRE-family HTH domain
VANAQSLLRTFGRQVRALRLARGWSQEELAAQAEVDRTFVGRVEAGKLNLTVGSIQKLARGLHCRVQITLHPD